MTQEIPVYKSDEDSIASLWWSTDEHGKNVVKTLLSGKGCYLNLQLSIPKICAIETTVKINGHKPESKMDITIKTNRKGFGNVFLTAPGVSGF